MCSAIMAISRSSRRQNAPAKTIQGKFSDNFHHKMSLKEPIKCHKTKDTEHKSKTKPKKVTYSCKTIENDWVMLDIETGASSEISKGDVKAEKLKPKGRKLSFAERSVDYPPHPACVHP